MHWAPFHDTNPPARLPAPDPGAPAPPGGAEAPPRTGPRPPNDDGTPPGPWMAGLASRPTTLLLHGPSRRVVSLGLFALAQATHPHFLWVDIRLAGEPPAATDPTERGWVSSDRLVTIDELDRLRPNSGAKDLDVSKVLSREESTDSVGRLVSFLSLPEATQQLLTPAPAGPRPGLVAVTNTESLLGVYSPHQVGPILEAHRRAGYSLFIGYADTPGPGSRTFDYVLRIDPESPRRWAEGSLHCEKGLGTGPLRAGAIQPLPEIPFIADVFRRALHTE